MGLARSKGEAVKQSTESRIDATQTKYVILASKSAEARFMKNNVKHTKERSAGLPVNEGRVLMQISPSWDNLS